MELTVVIPCLNEHKTLARCIAEAEEGIRAAGTQAEIVIADNGSTDGSIEIAKSLGARVVHVPVRGYGAALKAGINAAEGKYVVMGDGDGSYDFREIPHFLAQFKKGHDIVMGNRFKGGIERGAMPFLNKYLGNPGITGLIWIFHGSAFGDTQCGLRGGSKKALQDLNLVCDQFDFASEMVIRAHQGDYKLAEIPVKLRPDDVTRKPHLRRWRDGVMHSKLILRLAFEK
jgi:glycosyltransferase involved in cell wall biosynthesis